MNGNMLRRMLPLLVALLVAIPLGWLSDTYAQSGPLGSPGPPGASGMQAPGAGMMQRVEGKIKSMDPSGRRLTLEDGTELTLPPTAEIPEGILHEGAIVKASYEEQDGQKLVTSLEVQEP